MLSLNWKAEILQNFIDKKLMVSFFVTNKFESVKSLLLLSYLRFYGMEVDDNTRSIGFFILNSQNSFNPERLRFHALQSDLQL